MRVLAFCVSSQHSLRMSRVCVRTAFLLSEAVQLQLNSLHWPGTDCPLLTHWSQCPSYTPDNGHIYTHTHTHTLCTDKHAICIMAPQHTMRPFGRLVFQKCKLRLRTPHSYSMDSSAQSPALIRMAFVSITPLCQNQNFISFWVKSD